MRAAPARAGRPVGDDVPAQHGATDHLARSSRSSPTCASPSAATTRRWRPRRGRIPSLGVDFIVRGEGDLTFRELLRALEDRRPLSSVAGLWFRTADGFQRNPPRPVDDAGATARCGLPRRAGARAVRLHDDGPADRRRRDLARLHVRLQLLLDHRDARAQLPSLRRSSA